MRIHIHLYTLYWYLKIFGLKHILDQCRSLLNFFFSFAYYYVYQAKCYTLKITCVTRFTCLTFSGWASLSAVAMAIAGYTEESSLWKKTCASLLQTVNDSYLRAMFAFLSSNKDNYDEILVHVQSNFVNLNKVLNP